MRVFLDASVWIASLLSSSGASAALIAQISRPDVTLLISPQTIAEVVRNLQKKATSREIAFFLDLYGDSSPELVIGSKSTIDRANKIIGHRDDAIVLAAALWQSEYFCHARSETFSS